MGIHGDVPDLKSLELALSAGSFDLAQRSVELFGGQLT